MSTTREKFATQVNSEILAAVRAIAEKEGRQIQTLVDEAFADLIEKRKKATPKMHVTGRSPRQPREIRFPVQEAREMTDYPAVSEAPAMRADQIERYGGSHDVRDPGLT